MKAKYYYKDGTVYEGEFWDAPHYCDETKVLHKEDDMPAEECANGTKQWYNNGVRHRENGLPAVEYANGTKYWLINGVKHRPDGAAIEWASGTKEWYVNGKEYTEYLPKDYLLNYMKLTGETALTLVLHPDRILRDSAKKYFFT